LLLEKSGQKSMSYNFYGYLSIRVSATLSVLRIVCMTTYR